MFFERRALESGGVSQVSHEGGSFSTLDAQLFPLHMRVKGLTLK